MEPNTNWPETVERIRNEHNDVVSVVLYFGPGDNSCTFLDHGTVGVRGEGASMQAAVEQCLAIFRAQMTDKWKESSVTGQNQIIVE